MVDGPSFFRNDGHRDVEMDTVVKLTNKNNDYTIM